MIDKDKFEKVFKESLGEVIGFPHSEMQHCWPIEDMGHGIDELDIVEAMMIVEEEMSIMIYGEVDNDLYRPKETLQQLLDRLYSVSKEEPL